MNNGNPANLSGSEPHTLQSIEDNGHVKIAVTDLDGQLRGKYISGKKFKSALKNGAGFCDVVLGWDREDVPINGLDITGWHTGFPDAPIELAPETLRHLPFEGGTAFCLSNFADQYKEYCPRSILQSVCQKAEAMGYTPFAGMEFEFTVFKETPESIRDKNFSNLKPMAPGSNSYSALRTSVASEFYAQVLETCSQLDIPLEGLHEETGAGFMEAAIAADDALLTADRATLFKHFMKVVAQKNELLASFMAKWSGTEQGQSGHIHLSLLDKAGRNLFHDQNNEHNISKEMRHFIGGQQQLLPEFLALMAPTVNSFKRLCPDFWAPTWGSWGIDNRTVALRVIPGSPKSQRIEYRVPGADCNPYLAMAAALASGLWGIENEIEPSAASKGNAYEQDAPSDLKLPTSLSEAATRLSNSEVGTTYFGESFVKHYAVMRQAEQDRFLKSITDWELSRYLETS